MKYPSKLVILKQNGFTIIELMIASMVFSVILLLVTTGVIQIGRSYYKGVLQSRTQETARNVIDEISRGIQFSGQTVVPTTLYRAAEPYPTSGGRYGFCINGLAYTYILDKQLREPGAVTNNDNRGNIFASYVPPLPCSNFAPDGNYRPPFTAYTDATYNDKYKELIGPGMRLLELNVELVAGTTDTYNITVAIATGERDLFEPDVSPPYPVMGGPISTKCKGDTGNQFCAVSRLTTTVKRRVKG